MYPVYTLVLIILITIIIRLSVATAADSTNLNPVSGVTPQVYSCFGKTTATTNVAMYETQGQSCEFVSSSYTTQCSANDVAVGVKYVYSDYTDSWGIYHSGASCYSLCQNMSLDQSTCAWR